MRIGGWTMLVLCAALAAPPSFAGAEPPESRPEAKKPDPAPCFSNVALGQAVQDAKATGKLVIADFTADWCAPCKLMDRTVWRDPNVEEWIKDHAVAVQIDVDAERDLARQQHVSALPTIIVYKDGEFADRRTGSVTAGQLTAWLESVRSGKRPGKTETVVQPEVGKGVGDAGKIPIEDRLAAARGLVRAGKQEKATKEFLWLWQNMGKEAPELAGTREAFLAEEMRRLASSYRPARVAFALERDAAEARLKTADRTFQDLDDWLLLNKVVGDEDRTLEWLDRIKNDADAAPTIAHVFLGIRDLLVQKNRWADLGRFQPDPLGEFRRARAMWTRPARRGRMDADLRLRVEAMHARMFRDEASIAYAAQLAAGNEAVARTILEEALAADGSGSMRRALVQKALDAGQPRRAHIDVLDKTDDGTDLKALRESLLKALGESAG